MEWQIGFAHSWWYSLFLCGLRNQWQCSSVFLRLLEVSAPKECLQDHEIRNRHRYRLDRRKALLCLITQIGTQWQFLNPSVSVGEFYKSWRSLSGENSEREDDFVTFYDSNLLSRRMHLILRHQWLFWSHYQIQRSFFFSPQQGKDFCSSGNRNVLGNMTPTVSISPAELKV